MHPTMDSKSSIRHASISKRKIGLIRVGTASWADPDFVRDWYPKGLPAGERLPWYARHFKLVEVNSSFYAIPDPRVVEHWVEQTPQDFVFDVKLFKMLSRHAVKVAELPPDLRSLASVDRDKAKPTAELERELLRKTVEAVAPLRDSGKLGALLLQLSPAFSPKYHRLYELAAIVDVLGPYGLAVELRNRNWMSEPEDAKEVVDYFRRVGVTLVMVDAPESENFTVMPEFEVVTNPKFAYLRLHGRDEKAYTTGRTVSERFKYEYSADEIQSTVDKAKRLAETADDVHVIYNNNHSNLAPKAAEYFATLLPNMDAEKESSTPA